MRATPAAAILLLWVVATPTAQAQADRRLDRLDAGTRATVAQLVDSLRAARVPAEPLIDKALEGRAKGAPGPRIVDAVRQWGRELAEARGALGPRASAEELIAGASVIRSGVATTVLGQIAAARPGRDLLTPLSVLWELTAQGIPTDSAAAAVLNVARQGGRDEDFHGLERGLQFRPDRSSEGGHPGAGPPASPGARPGAPGSASRGRGRPPHP